MAAGPNANPGNESGFKKIAPILVPVAGVAALVILVVVVAAISDSPSTGSGSKGAGSPQAATLLLKADAATLSDGTEPGAEDPGLRDIGNGLKIRDLKEGTGEPVPPGATVRVYYTGWLTNGTVFDSSARRGETIEFSLGGVIKGWQQGIPGMKVGGVRKLVVPPDLGYGAHPDPGGPIPPNAVLIFEVQMVAFK